ncbi:hypothetical protein [Alkalihalobacillus sp. CinArs1]|uniref:hypothetical protein n=1 Tax=Alkalihalobacillus sp. CinArs1 TaxID=2995314 RepID=UPI0022DE1FA6|nr:hypothetical protein [Alkalihalobacillus sp. CinArs1]
MQNAILEFLRNVEEPVSTHEIMEYLSNKGYSPDEEELVRAIKEIPPTKIQTEFDASVVDPAPSVLYKAGPEA